MACKFTLTVDVDGPNQKQYDVDDMGDEGEVDYDKKKQGLVLDGYYHVYAAGPEGCDVATYYKDHKNGNITPDIPEGTVTVSISAHKWSHVWAAIKDKDHNTVKDGDGKDMSISQGGPLMSWGSSSATWWLAKDNAVVICQDV